MTDLVTTGPDLLDLRFGQSTVDLDDGRVERAFLPRTHHHAERGYLHPGIAASAIIEAARTCVGLPLPLTSVSVQLHRLIPLGHDLRAVVDQVDDATVEVEIRAVEGQGWSSDPIGVLAHGTVRAGDPAPIANEGELRSYATVPVPQPEAHEPHARCFVCGQDNTQGLRLLPGWSAPDATVTAFVADENLGDDGVIAPTAIPALLTCPTLLANRDHLDRLNAPGAVATTLEVRFHGDARVPVNVRTVGQAAEPGVKAAQGPDPGETSERRLRGGSALLTEEGTILATAHVSWNVVDELPERDPEGIPPVDAFTPLKGGRPEERSREDWGRPLPGRREAPGPRSEGDRQQLPSPQTPREADQDHPDAPRT